MRVALGVVLGGLYAALDAFLDSRLMMGMGTRFQWVAALHEVVDFVLPILAGCILALAVHSLRVRADAVLDERRRTDELRGRLHKIERDQAVWVVAASLLHELRNPLHALGLLLDELDALPEHAGHDRQELLARAHAQCDRLIAELSALKSLPGSEAPELPQVDLAAIVTSFVEELTAPGVPVRVMAHITEPVPASADATYVQIILQNLIENALDALRERSPHGVVQVDVARSGDRAVVRVADDGPGIDPDAEATIFEPLRTTKARGMGLGLSIARALARAMDGDLLLESARPAVFRLELSRRP